MLGRYYKMVLVPELNMGQSSKVLCDRILVDAWGCNKTQGKPFKVLKFTTYHGTSLRVLAKQ